MISDRGDGRLPADAPCVLRGTSALDLSGQQLGDERSQDALDVNGLVVEGLDALAETEVDGRAFLGGEQSLCDGQGLDRLEFGVLSEIHVERLVNVANLFRSG